MAVIDILELMSHSNELVLVDPASDEPTEITPHER
jgi:hypothetical protein